MRKTEMEFEKQAVREQAIFLQDLYDWLLLKEHGLSALERMPHRKPGLDHPGNLIIRRRHLPMQMPLERGVDVKAPAAEYSLTGGQMKNAVLAAARSAAYRASRAGGPGKVRMEELEEACGEGLAGSAVMGTAERVIGFGSG